MNINQENETQNGIRVLLYDMDHITKVVSGLMFSEDNKQFWKSTWDTLGYPVYGLKETLKYPIEIPEQPIPEYNVGEIWEYDSKDGYESIVFIHEKLEHGFSTDTPAIYGFVERHAPSEYTTIVPMECDPKYLVRKLEPEEIKKTMLAHIVRTFTESKYV